jgi:GDPmannose 4,6-dehydratase
MLEAYRTIVPKAKFYQASSSEMFGNCVENNGSQNENTQMKPVSPYGCAKLLGYNLVRHYRHAYNLHASNGILFNHESPRRGSNFVTNKVVKTAVEIAKGKKNKLVLGNLDSYRDWGHSKDYVKAMNMIVNHSVPDDFVVATGKTYSVRDLCKVTFDYLDMDYNKYIIQDDKFRRPEELNYLCGDSTKARNILGWEPEYTFETMIKEMVDYWNDNIK